MLHRKGWLSWQPFTVMYREMSFAAMRSYGALFRSSFLLPEIYSAERPIIIDLSLECVNDWECLNISVSDKQMLNLHCPLSDDLSTCWGNCDAHLVQASNFGSSASDREHSSRWLFIKSAIIYIISPFCLSILWSSMYKIPTQLKQHMRESFVCSVIRIIRIVWGVDLEPGWSYFWQN